MNRAALQNKMPMVQGISFINSSNAINSDIITALHEAYPRAVQLAKEIANQFEGADAFETAFKIWHFLRTQITYEADGKTFQDIRLPNRLIRDGKGDCKSYSLFAASVLANLGYPVMFRYASYNSVSSIPTHVYVVTADEKGTPLIVDGVYSFFNSEKPYQSKKDFVMQVRTLSGIGDSVPAWEDLRNYRTELITRAQSLPEVSPERKALQYAVNRLDQFVKAVHGAMEADYLTALEGIGKGIIAKIALSPGRNAYLEIVQLNVRGIATKLAQAIAKDKNKIQTRWEKLGGRWDKLANVIAKGKDKKPLLGSSAAKVSGIGILPAVPAMLAAAAPVLIGISNALKELGINTDDLNKDVADAGGDTTPLPEGTQITDNENTTGSGSGSGSGGTDIMGMVEKYWWIAPIAYFALK